MSKYQLIASMGLILVCVILFSLWRMEVKDRKKIFEDLQAAEAQIVSCKENSKLTERVVNDYQTDINRLNADLERLRGVKSKCLVIDPASEFYTGSRPGAGHGEQNGISSQWLYEYAGEAEKYRIERNACKDFVNSLWASK